MTLAQAKDRVRKLGLVLRYSPALQEYEVAERRRPRGTGYFTNDRDDAVSTARALCCNGHPAGSQDPMGVTKYCDGSCRD